MLTNVQPMLRNVIKWKQMLKKFSQYFQILRHVNKFQLMLIIANKCQLMLANVNKCQPVPVDSTVQLRQAFSSSHRWQSRQTQLVGRQLPASRWLAQPISSMSVYSNLQFTHASRSSHTLLSKQPQIVQGSKLVLASLSYAELGTAQPQLVLS